MTLISPCGRSEAVSIPPGWSRIGRSPAAEIRLDDPGASRRHAVIVRGPTDRLQIIDDRSLTGTYLNGEAVQHAVLVDGDELTIGDLRILVDAPRSEAAGAGSI